jgi:hypothetical protein
MNSRANGSRRFFAGSARAILKLGLVSLDDWAVGIDRQVPVRPSILKLQSDATVGDR